MVFDSNADLHFRKIQLFSWSFECPNCLHILHEVFHVWLLSLLVTASLRPFFPPVISLLPLSISEGARSIGS